MECLDDSWAEMLNRAPSLGKHPFALVSGERDDVSEARAAANGGAALTAEDVHAAVASLREGTA